MNLNVSSCLIILKKSTKSNKSLNLNIKTIKLYIKIIKDINIENTNTFLLISLEKIQSFHIERCFLPFIGLLIVIYLLRNAVNYRVKKYNIPNTWSK